MRLIYIVLNPKMREKLYRMYSAIVSTMVTTSSATEMKLDCILEGVFNE